MGRNGVDRARGQSVSSADTFPVPPTPGGRTLCFRLILLHDCSLLGVLLVVDGDNVDPLGRLFAR